MPKAAPLMAHIFCVFTAAFVLPCLGGVHPFWFVLAESDAQGPASNPPAVAAPAVSTGESTGSTTYREAKVLAVWVNETTSPPEGGNSRFTVRVSSNQSGDAAVGLVEHILGSSGDVWKSSAWIAALAASNASNHLLTDYEFLLKVRGTVDGPSAGMLIAATMLALINQDPILPDVTITGRVNPDGTVGPVSGIPYKMDGAKKAGIKVFGYPAGQNQIDEGSDEMRRMKVEQLGEAKGIRTVAVADIYGAYEILTGRKLGRPLPLAEAEMALSTTLSERLRALTKDLLSGAKGRIASCKAAVAQLPENFRKSTAAGIEASQRMLDQSEIYAKSGAYAMAYNMALRTDQASRLDEKNLEWLPLAGRNDWKAVIANYHAQCSATEAKLDAMANILRARLNVATVAGRMSNFNNYLQFWAGRAAWMAATAERDSINRLYRPLEQAKPDKLKGKEAELAAAAAELTKAMTSVTVLLAMAEGSIQAAANWASFPLEQSAMPAPNQANLNRRLADSYGPAAAAGLAYFESTLFDLSSHDSQATAAERNAFKTRDPGFASFRKAAEHATYSGDDNSDTASTPEAVMDRLACGVYSYFGMAAMMCKYYNLTDVMTREKVDESMNRMIESSRLRVLQEATLVKKALQFIPDSIKWNFVLGDSMRNTANVYDKLGALICFWRAHFLCQLAQMMAKAK